jgi:hypothetical protein
MVVFLIPNDDETRTFQTVYPADDNDRIRVVLRWLTRAGLLQTNVNFFIPLQTLQIRL